MKNNLFSLSPVWFRGSLFAMLLVAASTSIMLLIGRNILGEGVIALLFLVPIAWITTRWGQIAGLVSATFSALAFDFFFIPPFYSFTVGNLEGWLILIIFIAVSGVVVRQIQQLINQTEKREREAIVVYELVSSLSTLTTRENIAQMLATMIQQSFLSKQVRVSLYKKEQLPPITYVLSADELIEGHPTLILAIDSGQKFAGDISIWQGSMPLPSENNWLVQSFIRQTSIALDRVEKNKLSFNPARLTSPTSPNSSL